MHNSPNQLNQLRIDRDRIAVEAFSGADVKTLLFTTFPAMVKELVGFAGQFQPDAPAIVLTSRQNEFIRMVSKHPYLEIAPLLAFTPEGLNATYYKYSTELLLAAMHASRILTGGMTAYSVFLSQLITNNEQKFSSVSFDKAYKDLAAERAKLNASLGDCFKKGSTKTESTLGDTLDRNADWQHVFHNIDNMTKLVNSVDRKALNKKIDECKELLEVIIKKIERNEFDGMSPQVIKNLSDGAFQIASELEFYAVVYYRVLALATSVNRTIDHATQVLNQA